MPRFAKLSALVLLSLIGLFAILWLQEWARPFTASSPATPSSGSAVAGGIDEPAASGRREHDTESEEAFPRSEWSPEGVTVDDLFGMPVVARIEPNRGSSGYSRGRTGEFRLDSSSAHATSLVVSAPGYEDEQVRWEPGQRPSSFEIRLRGSRQARVSVSYSDGEPVVGATVAWDPVVRDPAYDKVENWIDTRLDRVRSSITTLTDSIGVATVDIGARVLVTVLDPRSGGVRTVSVRPGEDVDVVIAATPIRLRFIHAVTMRPMTGLDVDAWYPREPFALADALQTSAEGEITLVGTSFPILVRRTGSQVWQSELLPFDERAVRCGHGGGIFTMISIERHPGPDPVEIGVRACAGRITLVDALTEEPITARVRVLRKGSGCERRDAPDFMRCTVWSPRMAFGTPDEIYQAETGSLDLPCLIASAAEGSATQDVAIIASGYVPHRTRLTFPIDEAAQTPPVVRLSPCAQRSLRVLHEDGTPFPRAIQVYSPDADLVCWSSRGHPDGVHGPFDWPGGELTVDHGGTDTWSMRLLERDLADVDTASLTIRTAHGGLVVEDVPAVGERIPLVAKLGLSLDGIEYRPDEVNAGRVHFKSLPPGSYLVGPQEWVNGAEMQSVMARRMGAVPDGLPMRVIVESAKVARVHWQSTWMAGRIIEGRVRVLGPGRIVPFLVPVYGPDPRMLDETHDARPVVFGRRSPRLPLDHEGCYSIRAEDPVPRVIAVCVADETPWGGVNGLHVLEAIEPGESVDIPTASIELRWRGPPRNERLLVRYQIPANTLHRPLNSLHSTCSSTWSVDQPFSLAGIPVHVSEIQVGDRVLSVDLEAGQTNSYEVELERLPQRRR